MQLVKSRQTALMQVNGLLEARMKSEAAKA